MEPFGVYVHFPFCAKRCDYCAFATYAGKDDLHDAYVGALLMEIERSRAEEGMVEASSVFFGGGTPSRLDPRAIDSILRALPVAADAEVTLECNPEDADASRFATYRRAGVNRISFGVQSVVPRVLDELGRLHRPESASRALELASAAGFASVNADLIYGARCETEEEFDQSLRAMTEGPFAPGHLSVYALTPEPGTPLGEDHSRHPTEDLQAARYEHCERVLVAAGYRWEEISNWAKPGHESRHNRLYWDQGDYRGFGSSAHSHRGGRRSWNVRTPERYIAAITSGALALGGEEVLDELTKEYEKAFLSLRTPRGVPDEVLPEDPSLEGLVERRDGRAVLTVKGRLLANVVAAKIESGTRLAVG